MEPRDRIKSQSITFRFSDEVIRNLRREAEQKDVSTNTLLNQIVKHLHWHANAPRAGFIAVIRTFIIDVLGHLSEQDIVSSLKRQATTQPVVLPAQKLLPNEIDVVLQCQGLEES
jgi:hypothetical protein